MQKKSCKQSKVIFSSMKSARMSVTLTHASRRPFANKTHSSSFSSQGPKFPEFPFQRSLAFHAGRMDCNNTLLFYFFLGDHDPQKRRTRNYQKEKRILKQQQQLFFPLPKPNKWLLFFCASHASLEPQIEHQKTMFVFCFVTSRKVDEI